MEWLFWVGVKRAEAMFDESQTRAILYTQGMHLPSY